jgi:hypothetical protein
MSVPGTVITYGSQTVVTLYNVITRGYRQQPVFDTAGQNVIYHKHIINVTGWCHGSPVARAHIDANLGDYVQSTYINPADTTGESAALSHRMIRYILMQPRQAFTMKCGNDTLLQAFPMSTVVPVAPPSSTSQTDVDVNNGPRCTEVNISQIVANKIFRVDCEFEICKVECDASGRDTNSSLVLSNVWSCTDDVDRNFMTTRTIAGTARMSTSLVNPHSFRNVVIPPLQPGMRRDSMQFIATDDGLNLQYTVVDKEVAFAPPKPATSWHMRHTESVSRSETGIAPIVSLDITLGGDANCDKSQLISIAAAIIDAKITPAAGNKARIILNYAIAEETSDDSNIIHATCTAKRTPDKDIAALAGIQIDKLKPIDAADLAKVAAIVGNYDRSLSRGSRPGDTLETHGPVALVAAFSTFLQSPCSADHAIYQQQLTSDPGTPVTGPTVTPTAYTTATIPGDQSTAWATADSSDNVYVAYQMESTYERRGMRAHCPVAQGSTVGAAPPTSFAGSVAAASQATSVIISLAPTIVTRVIRMVGERLGRQPVFPSPADTFTDGQVNYTFLDERRMVGTPERDADGNLTYREQREYTYAADRDPLGTNASALRAGVNPNDSFGLFSYAFSNDSTGDF